MRHPTRRTSILPLAAFFTVLASLSGAPAARAVVRVPSNFVNDQIYCCLNQPNSFAFLPDGRLLYTEQRTGNVRLFVNGHIASNPLVTVPNLASADYERGLQGVAVDPAWPVRPFVYLYYSRTGGFIRLVRYTASGDLSLVTGENLTLSTPLLLIDDLPDLTVYHQSGCVRFGADGMLYVSVGDDDAYYCMADDPTTLHGEILRMNVATLPVGGGPQVPRALLAAPGNPFAASPDSNARLVFAYGMRNPWRFQMDRVNGFAYGCDVGESDFEEENEIQPGDYLGWPYREGDEIMIRPSCPEPGGPGTTPYKRPIAQFGRDANLHAVVSAGSYRPAIGGVSNWPPAYYSNRGDVFYGDYYVGYLKRLTYGANGWAPAAPVPGQPTDSTWASGLISAVDFLVGPDGSLWWMSQFDSTLGGVTGTLNRIRYVGPTAVPQVPASAGTLLAAPNPFRETTDLSFRLSAQARASLAIFDVSGRKVRTLWDGSAPAGETRAPWDGEDARGVRVPAGVYLARLERDGTTPVTIRLLRLR
jgi:glucose/arabinose dehydrogenase